MNLLPKAGDIVVMSECLAHAVLPWRATDKSRITMQMRYKCGDVYKKHASSNPEPWLDWPADVMERVSPGTRAIVAGDAAALRALPQVSVTEPRQQSCSHPPEAGEVVQPADPAPLTVSVSDAARMVSNDAAWGGGVRDVLPDTSADGEDRGFMVTLNPHHLLEGEKVDGKALFSAEHEEASAFSGLTHTERYLLDCHGILILRAAMSADEVGAARAAVERTLNTSAQYGGILDEPALQSLITHPRLMPVLLELMEGEPHVVSISALHKPAAATRERPSGAAQLHCQREYGRNNAHFAVRKPGRCYADNVVCFPYFTDCFEGDGGLIVVPGRCVLLLAALVCA